MFHDVRIRTSSSAFRAVCSCGWVARHVSLSRRAAWDDADDHVIAAVRGEESAELY